MSFDTSSIHAAVLEKVKAARILDIDDTFSILETSVGSVQRDDMYTNRSADSNISSSSYSHLLRPMKLNVPKYQHSITYNTPKITHDVLSLPTLLKKNVDTSFKEYTSQIDHSTTKNNIVHKGEYKQRMASHPYIETSTNRLLQYTELNPLSRSRPYNNTQDFLQDLSQDPTHINSLSVNYLNQSVSDADSYLSTSVHDDMPGAIIEADMDTNSELYETCFIKKPLNPAISMSSFHQKEYNNSIETDPQLSKVISRRGCGQLGSLRLPSIIYAQQEILPDNLLNNYKQQEIINSRDLIHNVTTTNCLSRQLVCRINTLDDDRSPKKHQNVDCQLIPNKISEGIDSVITDNFHSINTNILNYSVPTDNQDSLLKIEKDRIYLSTNALLSFILSSSSTMIPNIFNNKHLYSDALHGDIKETSPTGSSCQLKFVNVPEGLPTNSITTTKNILIGIDTKGDFFFSIGNPHLDTLHTINLQQQLKDPSILIHHQEKEKCHDMSQFKTNPVTTSYLTSFVIESYTQGIRLDNVQSQTTKQSVIKNWDSIEVLPKKYWKYYTYGGYLLDYLKAAYVKVDLTTTYGNILRRTYPSRILPDIILQTHQEHTIIKGETNLWCFYAVFPRHTQQCRLISNNSNSLFASFHCIIFLQKNMIARIVTHNGLKSIDFNISELLLYLTNHSGNLLLERPLSPLQHSLDSLHIPMTILQHNLTVAMTGFLLTYYIEQTIEAETAKAIDTRLIELKKKSVKTDEPLQSSDWLQTIKAIRREELIKRFPININNISI